MTQSRHRRDEKCADSAFSFFRDLPPLLMYRKLEKETTGKNRLIFERNLY
jgi:hypothetical protein